MWGKQLHSQVLPWGGTEEITAAEDLEETVMLGLRLRSGLSLREVEAASGKHVDAAAVPALVDEGLLEVIDPVALRVRPTLRGRLLNDLVIERVLDALA